MVGTKFVLEVFFAYLKQYIYLNSIIHFNTHNLSFQLFKTILVNGSNHATRSHMCPLNLFLKYF
jgi:hypothetical protein